MPDVAVRDGESEAKRRINHARHESESTIDLSDLDLSSVPEEVMSLTRLRELNLSYNRLSRIPESIGELKELSSFRASGNQLACLPESLGSCEQLQFLDVHGNYLTRLPDSIGRLSLLRELAAAHNQLTCLPSEISKNINMTHLDLSENLISDIEALRGLRSLRILYLRSNAIECLPSWIGELSTLIRLSVADNLLTGVPESIGMLSWLRALYLNDNKLRSLPETLEDLTSLRELYINSNRIETLPETLGRLTNLEGLFLNDNRIPSLPQSLGDLGNLREFHVENNEISELPRSIGQLRRLRVFCAAQNRIKALPKEMANLTALSALDLHSNPCLDNLELEAALEPQALLDFYFRTLKGARPLMEAKLILVGRGGVGKTSLVKRLLHDDFRKGEPKTEGIAISPWAVDLKNGERARLHVWDFGGQDILHATHQFFLTRRSLYLLVLSGREGSEDRDAEYWLKLITSWAPDSPVIVVLNKIDECPFDVNRRGFQQRYPMIQRFVSTGCEKNINIGELHQAIVEATNKLEHLRDGFPDAWFQIKDRLAGMEDNYLTYKQYQEECSKRGEDDPEAQDSLASVLNALGIALNYKDDARLRDTHVLKPRWVTQGIYKILDAPTLAEKRGELRLEDLSSILDKKIYPQDRHLFLIELMRKFELCFRFPDNGGDRYLLPELLSKEQSPEVNEFPQTDSLAFEYKYEVLLEGLLPRFIARTYVHSQNEPRWRSGVILHFEDNRALVAAEPSGDRVRILVSGPVAGRRRLLAIIRAHFEEIHESYKAGVPLAKAMVPVPGRPGLAVPYDELTARESVGQMSFDLFHDGQLISVHVRDLLDGVDLTEQRGPAPIQGVRLFYSYSHKDERFKDGLRDHLSLLHRQGLITEWHDRLIPPGGNWEEDIDRNIEQAKIILLLVSANFITSEYCWSREMTEAMKRHERGEAKVIPVIVQDCRWESAPFGKLQALPRDGRPVARARNRNTAWSKVAKALEEEILKSLGRSPTGGSVDTASR